MQDDPILRELIDQGGEHIAALIRCAYGQGKKAGEEAARARVLSVFGVSPAPEPPSVKSSKIFPFKGEDGLAANAHIGRPLREIMCAMDIREEGVGPIEIATYIQRHRPAQAMDVVQVRSGLKGLEKRGDVERVRRGRYRPTPRLLAEFKNHEMRAPSEDQSLGASKANGALPLNF